jgi:hypothetical protein
MARHALMEPATDLGPADVASMLCGAHAQVLSAAELSIGLRRAAELFDELSGELEYVELDGEPGWVVAGDTGTPPRPHRGIRLLPYFDAFVVAGQPRERLYPGAAATRGLTPTGQAGNYPVLLVDGVVAGVWHHHRSGQKLDDEVELVGAVMEAQPTLTVGTVTVGAHA